MNEVPNTPMLGMLKDGLLQIDPNGATGFEGLVLTALSDLTGFSFRIAHSGFQFGRDGSAWTQDFAIAVEAKRYDGKISLQELSGKAAIARQSSRGTLDLWILTTTSAVPDQVATALREQLEQDGISLLILDWSEFPLPSLAVLLAAAIDPVEQWLTSNAPDVSRQCVDQLKTIRKHPSFDSQREALVESSKASTVGLESLRAFMAETFLRTIESSKRAREAYGQYIAVADRENIVVDRRGPLNELTSLLRNPESDALAVVLGEEGVGKSWLVTNWLYRLADKPVILLISGSELDMLERDPLRSLAAIIAKKEGRSETKRLDSWIRRLSRWRTTVTAKSFRFVVVVDGINQRFGHPWATILDSLHRDVTKLGGRLVVTARPGYWLSEVSDRLPASLSVDQMTLLGYTDAEVAEILKHTHVAISKISSTIREFIRNPRVCSVAIKILRSRALEESELTKERLLMDYWRFRLEERGDLIAHGVDDFRKLLISHASRWRKNFNARFDRDDWQAHSGLARRQGPQSALNDLSEIEEGAFMTLSQDVRGSYQFRDDALPFAVALMLNHELAHVLAEGKVDAHVAVQDMLGTVEGFDAIGPVLVAATGLACLDEIFPHSGVCALLLACLDLQNTTDELYDDLAAYFGARPDAFLDAIESPTLPFVARRSGREFLSDVIVSGRKHKTAGPAIEGRVRRWMGRWSRNPIPNGRRAARDEHATKFREKMDAEIGSLSAVAREAIAEFTNEVEHPNRAFLDKVAIAVIAGRPLEAQVDALFGWCLVQTISLESNYTWDDVCWTFRSNSVDASETQRRATDIAERFRAFRSDPIVGKTIHHFTRVLGLDSDTEEDAQSRVESKRRKDSDAHVCNPDYVDDARVSLAEITISNIDPSKVFSRRMQSTREIELEEHSATLARYKPEVLIDLIRLIISSVDERDDEALRSLSFRLPELSPLLDALGVERISNVLQRTISNRADIRTTDDEWYVINSLLRTILPHLAPSAQVEALLTLPRGSAISHDLRWGLSALSAQQLERYLTDTQGDEHRATLVLFHAAYTNPQFTERSVEMVVSHLFGGANFPTICAANLVRNCDEQRLSERVVDKFVVDAGHLHTVNDYASDLRGEAIATCVVRCGRPDLAHLVHDEDLPWVALAFGEQCLQVLCDSIERQLRKWNVLSDDPIAQDADPSGADRSNENIDVVDYFLGDWIDVEVLEFLYTHRPKTVDFWLEEIEKVQDPAMASRLAELRVRMSSVCSIDTASLPAAIDAKACIYTPTIVYGPQKVLSDDSILFRPAQRNHLGSMRLIRLLECKSDADIQKLVTLAEQNGETSWLEDAMETLWSSPSLSRQAMALTMDGLRLPHFLSKTTFDLSKRGGFIRDVAAYARDCSNRCAWSLYWLRAAGSAETNAEFWRYGKLVEEVADFRTLELWGNIGSSKIVTIHGATLADTILRSAKKTGERREKTIFGLRAPSRELFEKLGRF